MHKITPNPPQSDCVSPYDTFDPQRLHEAAERALDHHLPPRSQPASDAERGNEQPEPTRSNGSKARPGAMFAVVPDLDNEILLVHASETLASLNVMASDLAFDLEDSRRHVALAIQQLSVLGRLLVDRALERLEMPA
ncbi:DUF6124 family protein [Pseudomonas sp. SZMC_28357]|uniref:DUF6124 family protein n=1 Tax=Pseudomonas sp. SZMC_28357 TaxID=3074380 RepID=UPI0028724F0F|nr:DUF6124 family protein [Pseudomonas sp. SZMC_28357]MDR9752847.1 DUF6124 family protein [Pseudomonas sp. SZMC_28357]